MKENSDLQGVILAGNGNYRYHSFMDDDTIPKALLPVANKPMLYYQLSWFEDAKINSKFGITIDIIILTLQNTSKKIREYIAKMYEAPIGTKIEVIVVDDSLGSADALRAVKDKIKNDFVLVSCDSILNFPACTRINQYRVQNAAVTCLLAESLKPENPADQSKFKEDETDEYLFLDSETSQLLGSCLKSELDQDLVLRLSMLKKHPNVQMYSDLRDAHVYIFKRWVLDFLATKKNISSVKSDLIPILLKAQYSQTVLKREGLDKQAFASQDLFQDALLLSGKSVESSLKCIGQIVPSTDICARAYSAAAYADINRMVLKTIPDDKRVADSADVKCQFSESMAGEGTKISERSSVKKSIIGAHCSIGKNVKISNCIIMDYVTIEDAVKLDGCILCSQSKVSEKSQLKDCEVGYGYVVDQQGKYFY